MQQEKKKFSWKVYFKYHSKWQLGNLVGVPLMWFFQDYLGLPTWLSLILFSFFGAILFYPIDSFIFRKNKQQDEIQSK